MKNAVVKTTVIELTLNRWPYGLELRQSEKGLLLCPRRKARANWAKAFRRRRPTLDDLAATRQLANEFDAKEWEW
jgi:hypothetical protein